MIFIIHRLDKFLYCTSTSGEIGGNKQVTLTVDNLPNHNHTLNGHTWSWGSNHNEVRMETSDNGAEVVAAAKKTTTNTIYTVQNSWNKTMGVGDSEPVNIMPPFMTVYAWK